MAETMDDPKRITPPNQAYLFPTWTKDYRITKRELGFCLVANRDIKKDTLIFHDSLEYTFSDVLDGDQLLFDSGWHDEAWWNKERISQYYTITRHTLIESHGIAYLIPDPTRMTAGEEQYRLEVPGMFMNHSCDPNTKVGNDGEDRAARDIKKGEELTVDYACYVYYEYAPYPDCKCGSSNCRRKMKGWLGLSDTEKKNLFHQASSVVRAHHMADIEEGPPLDEHVDPHEESVKSLPVRKVSSDTMFRLVCPGPGSASDSSGVAIKPIENNGGDGKFGLFASQDFCCGDRVYEFWCQPWPTQLPKEFDMVAPTQEKGDEGYPEGTAIRINADCARKYPTGETMFSSWDLLTAHSTEPNIEYDDEDFQERENWCIAYAARDIKAGEQITANHDSVPLHKFMQ